LIRGSQIPGGQIRINYLEAYCRAGSTDADWVRHTVIPHQSEVLSLSDDRKELRLRDTIADGVTVEHQIIARDDEVLLDLRPLSPLIPSNGLIGVFSGDERWIFATAWEPYQELFQGVIRCVHSDFRLGGLQAVEHIHDGTVQSREALFEPRHAPMELRFVNEFTAELYQRPTPFWGLESCMRYELLSGGGIELTFECIPRQATFSRGYFGLFWASYIDRPESLDIHFQGVPETGNSPPGWQRGITPKHGTFATHRGVEDHRTFAHDPEFPLELPFGFSRHRYIEPWYFGVCRGMAFVQIFRPQDRVWLTQSPSGGGTGSPAWDFQWFVAEPIVGRLYQLKMRAAYVPLEQPDDLASVRQQVHQVVARLAPGLE